MNCAEYRKMMGLPMNTTQEVIDLKTDIGRMRYNQLVMGSLKITNKYHNEKVEIDGIKFDSKHEGNVYVQLKKLQDMGLISDLRTQVKFVLEEKIPKVQREIYYKADFTFIENNKLVVAECKGVWTSTSLLKKKLFVIKYPDIEFRVCYLNNKNNYDKI